MAVRLNTPLAATALDVAHRIHFQFSSSIEGPKLQDERQAIDFLDVQGKMIAILALKILETMERQNRERA
jgi:hypothetical protein